MKTNLETTWVEVPVNRGFAEIAPAWKVIKQVGGGVLLGGYVRYMCSPRTRPARAHDLDIYSPDEATFEKLSAAFDEHLDLRHENPISRTYQKTDHGDFEGCPPVQLIKPFNQGAIVATGSLKTILDSFDFTIVRVGLSASSRQDHKTGSLMAVADADFLKDEKNKLLRIKNIHCPISSMLRCMKYAKKGYWMKPRQAMDLFLDWMERPEYYRAKILALFAKERDITKEEINELEALLRID